MKTLDVIDGRTPEQLVADGDHRWPIALVCGAPADAGPPFAGRLYVPSHLRGRERRLFVRRLLEAEPEDEGAAAARRADFTRAGGGALCPQCGEAYFDHPADPTEPDLTIACDRRRLKL